MSASEGSIDMSDNEITIMTTYTSQLEGMVQCSSCKAMGTHMAHMSGNL